MLFFVQETNTYMDAFCNSTLWNSTLTWYHDTPDFTVCFKRSVLVWVPCFFLWSCLPFEIYNLKKSTSRDIPLTLFNVNKLTSCLILITLSVIHFLRNVSNESATLVDIYSPVIQIFSFSLFLILTWMNFKMGIRSSGTSFIFTLLLVICGAPELRSEIIVMQTSSMIFEEERLQSILYTVYYVTVLLAFFLNCFVDPKPRYELCSNISGQKGNPEENANFCSRLYYCWFDRFVWKAYRKPLQDDDFWNLDRRYTSAAVVPKFEKRWNALVEKNKKLEIKTSVSSNRAVENDHQVEYRMKPQKSLSFVRPLFRIYLFPYIIITFYLMIENICLFISPQLLNLLISFVNGDEPSWKGYVYSTLFLIVALGQSLVLSIYNTKLLLIQMVVRSTMVEIVYKKTLKISNQARKNFTTGEIVNLMSSDIRKFTNVIWNFNVLWSAPFQIIGVFYFLWTILGPSAFSGILVIIALIPLNSYLSSNLKIFQRLRLKHKDRRIRIMNEILTGIKVIKLYAWENNFEKQIQDIRNEELTTLRKQIGLNITLILLWNIVPFLISLVTFATYVLSSEDHVLDAQKVFVSVSLFNILKNPMSMLPQVVSEMMQAGVSITRINKFLNAEELDPLSITHETETGSLVIKNGTFSRASSDESPQLTNINLEIKRGALVAIVGPVGSGKSSLISAFLGEMHKIYGIVDTKGLIAYVPQIAWIRNTTLRENITLGSSIEESFYRKIIESCALTHDLKILPGGDLTEIGEKGINLSGGQKQRVSLARAICSQADVYLLDDPLSAVDAQVGNHIFQCVLSPDGLLGNKTRVMVTHSTTFLSQVDLIVVMKNGSISEIGTFSQLLANNESFSEFLRNYTTEKVIESAANETDSQEMILKSSKKIRTKENSSNEGTTKQTYGFSKNFIHNDAVTKKLIKKEHIETGYVKGKVYQHFISSVGIIFPIATMTMFFCLQSVIVYSNFWLSEWSTDTNVSHNGIQNIEKRNYYLGYYAFFGLLQVIFNICGNCILFVGFLRASTNIHEKLVSRVLKWPLKIFDITPLGRILNRFGYDIDVVDYTLAMKISKLLLKLGMIISTLFVVSYTTPPFIFICIVLLILFRLMQKFYLATSQQLKRMESNSRSPIYSHFAETVTGLESIRAYRLQEKFISLSREKVDFNQTRVYIGIIATRWSTLRLEIIANMVVFFSSLFAVIYRHQLDAGLVGVSVSYSLQITKGFSWLMRNLTEIETLMVAVERIKEFEEYPIEAVWNLLPKNLSRNWPHSGGIQFLDYKLRYDADLDLVLKGLTFFVKGGEKVGIVGRTGAGKSSLALGLFRILEPAGGSILIDGIDICNVGLHDLRSRLSIIPQDPALFSGTLRLNLDPFENHRDDSIWNVLEQTRLKQYFSAMPDGLQYVIDEGGINLSVGQRQLICLARALLRKTKILILDEATAAIDLETDELIQTTIRREFYGHTVLTIAHRLNTIMDYDRILVLEDGCVEDYDTPESLLKKETSFYELAKEAGLI